MILTAVYPENFKSFISQLFKYVVFILLSVFGVSNVYSQTFSLRFHEETVTVLSNVWEIDIGYRIGGVIPDKEDGFHYDALICSLSPSGELLYSKNMVHSNVPIGVFMTATLFRMMVIQF